MKRKTLFLVFCLLGSTLLYAQKTIQGTIFDEYLEPFSGAIINSPVGTSTSDFDGAFTLNVKSLPITINVSSVGYSTETIVITDYDQEVNVILKETYGLDQVVISASRTPERIMESPVTIERIDNKFIKNTASPNFYEGLKNLKGINILDNNYLTKAVVSNRGFASTDNVRFVQLIDGYDSAVPVFDYSLGNLFGLNELDVKNVEILPGAASALYGANAINGILLMTSKNPFEDTGVSAYAKTGFTSQDVRGSKPFYDFGFRFAHKVSEGFAAKINVTYQGAQDWLANDISNINGEGTSHLDGIGDPNYDGVNVYGDDFSLNLVDLAMAAYDEGDTGTFSPLLYLLNSVEDPENIRISRTGFNEEDLIDYSLDNLIVDTSLHFRPWGENKTEIIVGSKYSSGDNITQASNRYSQTKSSMNQYRLEFKGNNYFFRAYYNENDAGQTYDSKLAGVYVNDESFSNEEYYTQYSTIYFGAISGQLPDQLIYSNEEAHNLARQILNATQIDPSSNQFNELLNDAKNTTIADGGAKLTEKSGYYNVDANYNFKDLIDFADIQVGGSFRSFALESDGQVYTDYDGILRYRQFGFYTQLQKKFADDRLKFTGTLRYDKSRNFTGNFSPRATLSYAAGKNRDHNFRVGFQTGFRNPTSQDQYSGIVLGRSILIGSVDENLERFERDVKYVSDQSLTTTLSGNDAFENSFTASSVAAFQNEFRKNAVELSSANLASANIDVSLLQASNFNKVKPELMRSLELGYRGAFNFAGSLLEVDLSGFYDLHENLITATEVVVPLYGEANNLASESVGAIIRNDFQRFIIATNTESTINVYGFAVGFNTKLFNKLNFGGSYAFSDFKVNESENDIDFNPAFNTPKNSVKLHLNANNLVKNFGFGIDTRWHDSFLYQTRFLSDRIVDSRFVVDTQINYGVPSIKSVFKLGATNLFGKDYVNIPEAGTIGRQYYLSWTINN